MAQLLEILDVKSGKLLSHLKEYVCKHLGIVAGSVVIELAELVVLYENVELVRFQILVKKS